MHQKDQIGGGVTEDERYTTWELKECPACGRTVIEYYTAIEIVNNKLRSGDAIDFELKIKIK